MTPFAPPSMLDLYMRDCFASSFLRHGPQLRVGWLPYDTFSTAEPSFRQTIERISTSEPERFTDADVLARCGIQTAAAPVAFIFHVSHCGSTLFANACKTVSGARVISEPPILGPRQLLRRLRDPQTGVPFSEDLHGALIRGAVNSLANGGPPKRYVFIKLMNLASLFLLRFRELFPDSPFLFLYRDPAEVIPKLQDAVSEAVRQSRMPLIRYALGKPDDWNPSAAQCWSTVFEAECTAAMLTRDVVCANYRDLTPERAVELLALAGVREDDLNATLMREAFRWYSKDVPGARQFGSESHDATRRDEAAQAAYSRIDALSRELQRA